MLNLLDQNRDLKISPEEFEAVGLDGLPNFDSMGAEGHHYDIESEFFLHHEGRRNRAHILLITNISICL